MTVLSMSVIQIKPVFTLFKKNISSRDIAVFQPSRSVSAFACSGLPRFWGLTICIKKAFFPFIRWSQSLCTYPLLIYKLTPTQVHSTFVYIKLSSCCFYSNRLTDVKWEVFSANPILYFVTLLKTEPLPSTCILFQAFIPDPQQRNTEPIIAIKPVITVTGSHTCFIYIVPQTSLLAALFWTKSAHLSLWICLAELTRVKSLRIYKSIFLYTDSVQLVVYIASLIGFAEICVNF